MVKALKQAASLECPRWMTPPEAPTALQASEFSEPLDPSLQDDVLRTSFIGLSLGHSPLLRSSVLFLGVLRCDCARAVSPIPRHDFRRCRHHYCHHRGLRAGLTCCCSTCLDGTPSPIPTRRLGSRLSGRGACGLREGNTRNATTATSQRHARHNSATRSNIAVLRASLTKVLAAVQRLAALKYSPGCE